MCGYKEVNEGVDHDPAVFEGNEPTCTVGGLTQGVSCRTCGEILIAPTVIPPNGHSFSDWTTVTPATCWVVGYEQRSCKNCDAYEVKVIPATGHSYEAVVTNPTCLEDGFTTYTCACGDSYVDSYIYATGHSFGEWTTVTAPTCTEAGSESRKCKTCGESETRELPAAGHSYEAVVTNPTCTEPGYTTFTCTCGDSYAGDETAALGHSFEDHICTICGERDYIPGDVDMNDEVNVDDVLALLWNVLFPEEYPIEVGADFDGNGTTDVDDVLALLWHVLFPEEYPLN